MKFSISAALIACILGTTVSPAAAALGGTPKKEGNPVEEDQRRAEEATVEEDHGYYYPGPYHGHYLPPYSPKINKVQCDESAGFGCACAVAADGPTALLYLDPENNVFAQGTVSCDESIFFPEANTLRDTGETFAATANLPILGLPLDCTASLTFIEEKYGQPEPTCLLNGEGMAFLQALPLFPQFPFGSKSVYEITGGGLGCEGAAGTLTIGACTAGIACQGPVATLCAIACGAFGTTGVVFQYELDIKVESKQCTSPYYQKHHPY